MSDPEVEQILKETVQSSLKGKCSTAEKEKVEKALNDVYQEGMTPKMALGMTAAEMEVVYTFGYNLYRGGKWKESGYVMEHLMTLDPYDFRYSFGRAAAYHMMQDYEKAAQYYLVSAFFNPTNPLPYFHMVDCLMKMNEVGGASYIMQTVLAKCGSNPAHQALKNRASTMDDSITKQIEETEQQGAAKGEGV